MFTLNKKSAGVPASAIDVGGTFEHEGEVFVRVKAPTAIGAVELKLNKTDVMCLSLETFQVNIVPGNTEVLKNKVEAVSVLSYE